MSAMAPATLDRIRQHLVGLKMPRSLEVLEHLLRQLERGEISALERLSRNSAWDCRETGGARPEEVFSGLYSR